MTVSLPADGNGAGVDDVVANAGSGSSSSSSTAGENNNAGSGNTAGTGESSNTAGTGNTVVSNNNNNNNSGGGGGLIGSLDLESGELSLTAEAAVRDYMQNRRALAARTDATRNVLAARSDSARNVLNNNRAYALFIAGRGLAPAVYTVKAASVHRTRRALFGRGRDPVATRAWLDRQIGAHVTSTAKAWNFDFSNGRPMQNSPSDRYAWERVTVPQKRAADDGKDDDAKDGGQDAAGAEQMQATADGGGGGGGGEQNKQQKQTKVTDYMGKTKKIANKDDESAAANNNKRSRLSISEMTEGMTDI